MPEQEHEVVVFEVDYLCDECGEPMRVRSVVGTKPMSYEHTCSSDHRTILDARYPMTRYRRYEDG